MPRAQRGRTSTVPLNRGRQIRIKDHAVDFDRYQEILENELDVIIHRLRTKRKLTDQIIGQAADALLCGRFIASSTNEMNTYERIYYCRKPKMCRICRSQAAQLTATSLVDYVIMHREQRMLGFVFSLPEPTTGAEEVEYTRLAKEQGFGSIKTAITAWRRRTESMAVRTEMYAISGYVLGIHSKSRDHSDYLWTHIHLVLFVHSSCPTSADGIVDYLGDGFQAAVGTVSQSIVKWRNYGIVQIKHLDKETRRKRKRGKTCSIDHAKNLIAYVIRDAEENDTPAIVAHRDVLYDLAGIVRTSTRSQSPGSPRKPLPHLFHPEHLKKDDCFIFPLDVVGFRELPAKDFDTQFAHQRQLARAFVERTVQCSTVPFSHIDNEIQNAL